MVDSCIEYNYKIILDDNETLLQIGIRPEQLPHTYIKPRLQGRQ